MGILRNTQTRDRRKIIESFSPFSHPDSIRGMIIGNDLDSVISACFLKSMFGWDVAAVYDYQTVWYSADESGFAEKFFQGAYVAIDLDIYHPNIFSLGHHILEHRASDVLSGHARSLNPNLMYGVNAATFIKKYPLGTIHFLLWLFDQAELSRSAELTVWLADSSFINGQSHRFRANVNDWVEAMDSPLMKRMALQIDSRAFEEELRDSLLPVFQKIPLCDSVGQVKSRHLSLGGFQCQWKDPNRENSAVHDLFETVSKLTRWMPPRFPDRFLSLEGKRSKISLQEVLTRHGSLDSFLATRRVFSYVFPYRDSINFTALSTPES